MHVFQKVLDNGNARTGRRKTRHLQVPGHFLCPWFTHRMVGGPNRTSLGENGRPHWSLGPDAGPICPTTTNWKSTSYMSLIRLGYNLHKAKNTSEVLLWCFCSHLGDDLVTRGVIRQLTRIEGVARASSLRTSQSTIQISADEPGCRRRIILGKTVDN
jgi:hypothetical protein